MGLETHGNVSCIVILQIVYEEKTTLPTEFKYVFQCYSGTLRSIILDNLIIPNPTFLGSLLCYSTFKSGFNDAKYETFAICLRSKQSEPLEGVIIY